MKNMRNIYISNQSRTQQPHEVTTTSLDKTSQTKIKK